jgi:hypothetical protein
METNPIEDIVSEVKSLMEEAYQQGIKDGVERQQSINNKLQDPHLILGDFISYVKKFRMTYVDGENRFSDENYVYTDESFIQTFLLKYDYYAED